MNLFCCPCSCPSFLRSILLYSSIHCENRPDSKPSRKDAKSNVRSPRPSQFSPMLGHLRMDSSKWATFEPWPKLWQQCQLVQSPRARLPLLEVSPVSPYCPAALHMELSTRTLPLELHRSP